MAVSLWGRQLSPTPPVIRSKEMCLAIPALVKSIDGYQAEVDIDGVTRRVSIQLTPEVNVGDYILLHTGYAINVIDENEARETLQLLKELSEAQ